MYIKRKGSKMTFEKLKNLIDNEDLLVYVDGQPVFEYVDAGTPIYGYEDKVWLQDNVFTVTGLEIEVDDNTLNSVEVFKYTEIDATFENLYKASVSQNKDKTDYLVFEDWGYEVDDIEEYIMYNGIGNISNVLKIKKVNV
jgi:hypothetical protein